MRHVALSMFPLEHEQKSHLTSVLRTIPVGLWLKKHG